ncbi:NAD(P)H-quinone oxidoreductase [Neisseria sp. Ec49-e6-T10]|uniref:NAD(P)H-quinone oxidoreductase n=1 Tax=Neisseria sp. Ec49-e6-T10 TaxID=3140744 RepID=UPI003EC07110
MKVWQAQNQTIELKEIELPQITGNQVLVKIKAFGLNRADLAQIAGSYPPPAGVTQTLGLEFAGVVEQSFEGSQFQKGDRVMALVQGGAYAQYAVCEEELLLKIPDQMDFITAASLPEAWCTVLLNLKRVSTVKKGMRVLLHASTGSVGSAAIKYARYCGAYVMATTRTADKKAFLTSIGAHEALLFDELLAQVDRIKNSGGVDMILDPIGQNSFEVNQKLLNQDGSLVIIGNMSGVQAQLNIGLLLVKRQKIIGSTLRSQPLLIRAQVIQDLAQIMPMIESGQLSMPVAKVFEWAQTQEALNYMDHNHNLGKIIVALK